MIKKTILVFSGIIALLLLGQIIFNYTYKFPVKQDYGVTFSPKFAQDLGMDWRKVYINILDDLNVDYLRLPTYWDELEPVSDQPDFSKVDFMLDEASKSDVKVILVLGARQPRWPECHIPSWVKNLSVGERQKHTLVFIRSVIQRYKDNPSVFAWQVENEPLLRFFGEGCDNPDENFLKEEVKLVRNLSSKSIIISDSGELGFWITPMRLSDIFGTTLYRRVYNPVLGHTTYPVLPYMYNVKSELVKSIFAQKNQKTIIVELQAEPWLPTNSLGQTNIEEQTKAFSLKDFENIVKYAKDTGFDTAYLWGAEWWFWMAQNGYPQYLEYAKTLF